MNKNFSPHRTTTHASYHIDNYMNDASFPVADYVAPENYKHACAFAQSSMCWKFDLVGVFMHTVTLTTYLWLMITHIVS